MVNDSKFEKKIEKARKIAGEKSEEANKSANDCFLDAYEKMAESRKIQSEACKMVDECEKYKSAETELNELEQQISERKNEAGFYDKCEILNKKDFRKQRYELISAKIENARKISRQKSEEANVKAHTFFEEAREKEAEAKEKMLEAFKKVDESFQYKDTEIKLDEAKEQIADINDKDESHAEYKGEKLGEKIKGALHDIKEKIVGKD